MDYRLFFGLIALLILTSGCLNGGSTQSEGSQAIEVLELSATPSTIFADDSTNVALHIRNSGQIDANLTIDSGFRETRQEIEENCEEIPSIPGDAVQGPSLTNTEPQEVCDEEIVEEIELHGNEGDRLLTNRCRDIFDVEDFSARGPGDQEADRYNLPTGSEARFSWTLSSENANVPIQGLSCNLRFQVPFDYEVSAFRQLQFVESRDITGTPDLESRSSAGPMMIDIETVGSTSEQGPSTFVEGDTAEVRVTMRNQAEEGSSYTGFIEADVPEVRASGFEFIDEDTGESTETCTDNFEEGESLTMRQGESYPIRCRIDNTVFEEMSSSTRGEVNVNAEYQYVKDLGSEEIEVESRGR